MKKISNTVVRGIFATLIGLLLIFWPEYAILYLVITVGILFIIPGIFSLVGYYRLSKNQYEGKPVFPIEAIGSIILGLLLVIIPNVFVNFFMYLLGILLIIGGIEQIVTYMRARRWIPIRWTNYILPVLILAAGIVIMLKPQSIARYTFMIFGIAAVVYGLIELFNSYRYSEKRKANWRGREIEDAVIVGDDDEL